MGKSGNGAVTPCPVPPGVWKSLKYERRKGDAREASCSIGGNAGQRLGDWRLVSEHLKFIDRCSPEGTTDEAEGDVLNAF